MKMIAINGSINSEAVEGRLDVLQEQLSDLSPSMEMIAEDYRQRVAGQFASDGAAGGTPWAPLAASTLKRKRGAGGIMVSSGALLDSLTDPDSPDHVETIDNLSLTFGSDLPYAVFQQTGAGWGLGETTPPPAPRHGPGVPMRPLLVLTDDGITQWVGFVAQQIQSQKPLLGAAQLGGMSSGLGALSSEV